MSTVYFDIKLQEFYTEQKPLYPYSFTELGQIARTRLQTYLASIAPAYTETIGDVITFNLTDDNRFETKVSTAPFEVTKSSLHSNIFFVKYGYVGLLPHRSVHGKRLFRSWAESLSNKEAVNRVFQSSDNMHVASASHTISLPAEISLLKDYNTCVAVVRYVIVKSA